MLLLARRLLLIVFLFTTTFSLAQKETLPAFISTSFSKGDYNILSSHFNEKIELNIGTHEGVYGKAQAKEIVKSFFEKHHEIKSFEAIHNGKSKENLFFSIGKLTTGSGTFRTYILYQKQDKSIIIKEIRIESEN